MSLDRLVKGPWSHRRGVAARAAMAVYREGNLYNRPENHQHRATLLAAAVVMGLAVDVDQPVMRVPVTSITFPIIVGGGNSMRDWAEENPDTEYRSVIIHLTENRSLGVWLGVGPESQLLVYDCESNMDWWEEWSQP